MAATAEMNARACGYLDLLYAVLFHPVRTFKELTGETEPDNRLLLYALFSVILVSAIAPVIRFINVGGQPVNLLLFMPLSALIGSLVWLLSGLVVAMLSYAFTEQTRFRTILTLSGFATLPWVFMGPISLLKVGLGAVGVVLCALFGLSVWLWSVLLFALAIAVTYAMTAERVLIVLVMPFVMTLIFIGWIFGFFGNISNLVPH
ncbi:MAG TPA: Yip1 family protein [Oculatellaceae cyanobacterium]